jgi:hypothetical protein
MRSIDRPPPKPVMPAAVSSAACLKINQIYEVVPMVDADGGIGKINDCYGMRGIGWAAPW